MRLDAADLVPLPPARAPGGAEAVWTWGALDLLARRPRLALVSSRRVPPELAHRIRAFLRAWVPGPEVWWLGAHTALEREALVLLLDSGAAAVAWLARGLAGLALPPAAVTAAASGRLLVLSAVRPTRRRSDAAAARRRTAALLGAADRVVVPYAEPGGILAQLLARELPRGRPVHTLEHDATAPLRWLGAHPLPADADAARAQLLAPTSP